MMYAGALDLRPRRWAAAGLAIALGGCFSEETPTPAAMDSTSTTAPDTTTAAQSTGPLPSSGTSTTNDPATTTNDSTTTNNPTTGPVDSSTGPDTAGSTSEDCVQECGNNVCGPDPRCGESCGECPVENGSSTMGCVEEGTFYCGLRVGFPDVLGMGSPPFGNMQFGYRIELFEDTMVRGLGALTFGAGPEVRMALYEDDGIGMSGGPTTLVLSTVAVPLLNGYNDIDVSPEMVPQGTYWVFMHTSAAPPLYRSVNPNQDIVLIENQDFATTTFPAEMGSPGVVQSYAWTIYVVVED
ncbi:MAG: hypothetical protein K0V04_31545 [Deltaproteobacteria bacterium]|nr:hypothetical protein [Deltaproteobacteria bacterium]